MKYYKASYTTATGKQWFVGGKFKTLRSAQIFLEECQDAVSGEVSECNMDNMSITKWQYSIKKEWKKL